MQPPADAPAAEPTPPAAPSSTGRSHGEPAVSRGRAAPAQRSAPPDEPLPTELLPTEPLPTDAPPAEPLSAEPASGDQTRTSLGRGKPLTDRERDILTFERQWWKHAGAKEQAIRDRFDLSATRYYQLLNGLLDNPAALAADPMVVGRLRRLRATRARNRRR